VSTKSGQAQRVVIIVSEHLKQALETEGITGPRFVEV
jgi:hypothetical protein